MAVVTFWNGTGEQVGTTSSSIAFATHMAIEHNIKILLISTSLNDSLMRDSFWQEKKSSLFGILKTSNKNVVERSGVEALDRALRSNKITPDMIKDYTTTVLTNRLEVLLGVEGKEDGYEFVKARYAQIIALASKYYDMVIVDLDKNIGKQVEIDILKISDVILATIPQREKEILKIQKLIEQMDILSEENTIYVVGRYMEDTKYNAKNISRNILKKKDIINTVPYNNLFFEASQEGKVIDMFLDLLRLKDKGIFIQELTNLYEMINLKIQMLQMNGSM